MIKWMPCVLCGLPVDMDRGVHQACLEQKEDDKQLENKSEMVEKATSIIIGMLQKQFRQGTLGEGIWQSVEHKPGNFVAVVRLPGQFVALDVRITVDEEWTEHLRTGDT